METTSPAENPAPSAPSIKDQLDYAKEHFFFTAEQRIKTFHVYAILLAASTAASLAAYEKLGLTGIVLAGFFHILIAQAFGLIDRRNQDLLQVTRRGLMQLENDALWPQAARLTQIEHDRPKKSFQSYTFAFQLATGAQTLLGIILLLYACFSISGKLEHPTGFKRTEIKIETSEDTTPPPSGKYHSSIPLPAEPTPQQ